MLGPVVLSVACSSQQTTSPGYVSAPARRDIGSPWAGRAALGGRLAGDHSALLHCCGNTSASVREQW